MYMVFALFLQTRNQAMDIIGERCPQINQSEHTLYQTQTQAIYMYMYKVIQDFIISSGHSITNHGLLNSY